MPLTNREKTWHDNHERLYEAALQEIERVGFNAVRIEKICAQESGAWATSIASRRTTA